MRKILVIILVSGFLSSCAPVIISRFPVPGPTSEKGEGGGELSLSMLGIPNGHMPPPGSCRIWYPGRPAGQQAAPFQCGVGRYYVPVGTYLLRRLDGNMVQVDEYDKKRKDRVVRTGTFQLSE